MTPHRAAGIIGLLATSAGATLMGQAPERSPQLQTFRAVTALVSVDVAVRRGHNPVRGLTTTDFALTDNGVPQRLESVSAEALPIDVTLVVDTSSSVISNIDEFKTEVRRFAKMLRPTDRIRVIAFASAVVEAVPMRPAGETLNLKGLDTTGATSLNDALFYTLLWPVSDARRHLIIVLTDGVDTVSTLSAAEVTAAAARVESVVHAVLVPPASPPATAWQARSVEAARAIALGTGGAVHDLRRAAYDFKQIVDDFHAGYVLRFVPEGVPLDGEHELRVTLAKRDAHRYTVRARKSYFGG